MAEQSAIAAVLAGVYAALNVAGMTALAPVYNHVPQTTTFPYVRVTLGFEERFDAFQQSGKDVLIEVQVFSQYQGDLEVAQIVSKAVQLLHYQSLTVSGHTVVASQYENTYQAGEEVINGKLTRQWVAAFRVTVQQA